MPYKHTSEDLNQARRQLVDKMISTHFQHPWQWELDIAGAPEDMLVYIKDISYGAIEIETEAKNVGGGVITMPVRAMPVTLSMTVRDNQDERVYQWFSEWAGQVVNGSASANAMIRATVNTPQTYLRKCTRYQLYEEKGQLLRKESPGRSWDMFVTVVGDISESTDDATSLLEFPVTCMQMFSV